MISCGIGDIYCRTMHASLGRSPSTVSLPVLLHQMLSNLTATRFKRGGGEGGGGGKRGWEEKQLKDPFCIPVGFGFCRSYSFVYLNDALRKRFNYKVLNRFWNFSFGVNLH